MLLYRIQVTSVCIFSVTSTYYRISVSPLAIVHSAGYALDSEFMEMTNKDEAMRSRTFKLCVVTLEFR